MRVQRVFTIAVAVMAFAACAFSQVSPKTPLPTPGQKKTIEGTIKKLEFTAPRVFIYVNVTEPDNEKPANWSIQTGSPAELDAKGIKRSDLRVGVFIRVR